MITKYLYPKLLLSRLRGIVLTYSRFAVRARRRIAHRISIIKWVDFFILVASVAIVVILYVLYSKGILSLPNESSVLRDILTINGVFSSILITYLLTRLTWLTERKQQLHSEAVEHSQKITEFRRILFRLIRYYQVWHSDASTKVLIDHGKFENLDFHEYKYHWSEIEDADSYKLVDDLMKHPDYSEGMTTVYLAMISLVDNRKAEHYQYQEELHNDFQYKGIYTLAAVERWMECDLLDSIWYWMNANYTFIHYERLSNHFEEMKASAERINSKNKGEELTNKLVENLASDVRIHLVHLRQALLALKKGLTGWTSMIIVLITISLVFGVLIPFGLIQIENESILYDKAVMLISSINLGLIVFFLLKFPLMIHRELKWEV